MSALPAAAPAAAIIKNWENLIELARQLVTSHLSPANEYTISSRDDIVLLLEKLDSSKFTDRAIYLQIGDKLEATLEPGPREHEASLFPGWKFKLEHKSEKYHVFAFGGAKVVELDTVKEAWAWVKARVGEGYYAIAHIPMARVLRRTVKEEEYFKKNPEDDARYARAVFYDTLATTTCEWNFALATDLVTWLFMLKPGQPLA